MKASLATATPEARERQQKNIDELEAQGIRTLSMDIWIGEDDMVKQIRNRGQGTQGPLDITMKILGLNEPVEVQAPEAGTCETRGDERLSARDPAREPDAEHVSRARRRGGCSAPAARWSAVRRRPARE